MTTTPTFLPTPEQQPADAEWVHVGEPCKTLTTVALRDGSVI